MHEDFLQSLTEETILSPETALEIMGEKDPIENGALYNKVFLLAHKWGLAKRFESMYKTVRRETIKRLKGHQSGRETQFTDQPVKLNCGDWIANDKGVQCEEYTQGGENVVMKFASPIPIMPVGILKNIDTDTEKIVLAFFKDSDWQHLTCERVTVASNNKIIELANRGIEVTSENAKLLVRYISDVVALNPDTIPRNRAVSHMGWVEDKFLPYDNEIRFDGEEEERKSFRDISKKGSPEKWIEYIKPLLLKNSIFRLTVMASFASILIERVNALPFVFHLWGGSGTCKTVAIMAAMSIWGNPPLGAMTRIMNMTPNSMMGRAAFLRNIPFGGDELQIIKDKFGNYDRLIMAITEGVERGRMTYNKNNEMRTWACSFLFTGEEPCTKSSSGGGVINRVIEIETTEKLVEDGNAVVSFLNENHGTVGSLFVDAVKKENSLGIMYSEMFSNIVKNIDTTEKQAMAAALILIADCIASTEIFGTEPLKINDIKPYLSSVSKVDVTERAYDFVIDTVAKYEETYFKPIQRDAPVKEIWGKLDEEKDGTDVVLINKTVLAKLLNDEGYDFEAVKTKWAEKGYLIKNSLGKHMHQTHCHGVKANYIKLKLFDKENRLPENI